MAKSRPGITLGEADYIQKVTDIVEGVKEYSFPKDMDELLYLKVDWFYFTIEDQRIVLDSKPEHNFPEAITIHYRTL